MVQTADINPRMLSWARETAGLSLDQAAEKLGLKDTAKISGSDKLLALEQGEQALTDAQLQKAASVYRRPALAFYLAEPPPKGDRGEDFRTTAGAVSARDNGLLDALMRDVRARQQMLRDVLETEDEAQPLPFVASAKLAEGPGKVAASIRNCLAVTEQEQKRAHGASGLFAHLRAAAERIGIYVLLAGDVGSHHTDISETVFRGFALADDVAPFVVINDNDAAPARAFTLIHELAHIWLGASGVSGPLRWHSENTIEQFCNAVAGEFLLPIRSMEGVSPFDPDDIPDALVETQRLAAAWNISQGVVAYRLASEGRITGAVANALFKIFADRWREQKKTREKSADDRGPSYYVVRRHRLGAALLAVVRRALQSEALTHTRAAKILGVSAASVSSLLQERSRAA